MTGIPNQVKTNKMTLSKELRHVMIYALIAAGLILLLKWLQWKFLIVDNSIDIYMGLLAIIFTGLGFWLAFQIVGTKTKTVIVEKEIVIPQPKAFVLNEEELNKLDLSNREYQVLQLLGQGYSNTDIAQHLFLSLSTIKTHVSNLYTKMGTKSRYQTLVKAKRLRIIE